MIKAQPRNAELYSLRALEDEQQLDFTAAESDWKAYVENSSDKISAQLALADFYHHRLRPADEIKTLSLVANAPAIAAEKLTPPAQQRSWQAFERIFGVIQAQGLPKDVSDRPVSRLDCALSRGAIALRAVSAIPGRGKRIFRRWTTHRRLPQTISQRSDFPGEGESHGGISPGLGS